MMPGGAAFQAADPLSSGSSRPEGRPAGRIACPTVLDLSYDFWLGTNVSIFDLLFIVLLLAAVVTVIAAAIAGIRGHGASAFRMLRNLGICAVLYLATATVVHFLLPLRILTIGDAQCSGDWCITVESVNRPPAAGAVTYYDVVFRVSSSARRVTQREKGLITYLIDNRGRRFDPAPEMSHVPLDVLLEAEQSVTATRTFKIPADAHQLSLVVAHEGGIPMHWFIIGRSPFDKSTVVRLDSGG